MQDQEGSLVYSDQALIWAIAEGSEWALEELYRRYGPMLLRYLVQRLGNRGAAEEVLQDVMLSVWRAAHTFRAEGRVRAWLLGIARNQAISHHRRHKIDYVSLDVAPPDSKPGPEALMERAEEADAIRRALEALPEPQRETVELVLLYGLTGPEAAKVLGVAEGTIKSRLHRAKRTLRKLILVDQDESR